MFCNASPQYHHDSNTYEVRAGGLATRFRWLIARLFGAGLGLTFLASSATISTIRNEPINVPLTTGALASGEDGRGISTNGDDLLIGLAFSGGGSRAAAFSYGVLSEFDRLETGPGGSNRSLLDRIDYVSGVSGGAVTRCIFWAEGTRRAVRFPGAISIARRRRSLRTPLRRSAPCAPTKVASTMLSNSRSGSMTICLHGATFAEFGSSHRPHVLINASDVYNRTPFLFNETIFKSICSDLSSYPSPARLQHQPPCLWCLRRSCSRLTPTAAAATFRTGSRLPKTIRWRRHS